MKTKTKTLESEWIITDGKVIKAIQTLENTKAPEDDTITNDQIKYGGLHLVNAIITLFNKLIKEDNVPEV
ncbi:hypothetical protein M0802_014628 [Mischocyttarus mexicanus]|nr:hypothetical protein M0802_014628 [Mischocyttarus mexicanus]